jgi:hypothetical protein
MAASSRWLAFSMGFCRRCLQARMNWMSTDSKDLQDQPGSPRHGPNRSPNPKASAQGQLGRQWRHLRVRQRRLRSGRKLMTHGLHFLRTHVLKPLAHCALGGTRGSCHIFLLPSRFRQLPGAHPPCFAPVFWKGGCSCLCLLLSVAMAHTFIFFAEIKRVSLEKRTLCVMYDGFFAPGEAGAR